METPTTPDMTPLLAYHGREEIKQEYLARVRAHREADELVQGHGYWREGKGCAVGCTLHSDRHADYERLLGVPVRLAHLEDAIFEGLPVEKAREWPEKFLGAIRVGADLSRVWHQFAHWLLTDSGILTVTDVNREALAQVAELHRRAAAGDDVSDGEWSAAWAVAWSAARSAADSAAARSAAWAVAWSAAWAVAWTAAWSVAAAADSAAAVAWSAERSAEARSAARSAASIPAWSAMADKLLELLRAA